MLAFVIQAKNLEPKEFEQFLKSSLSIPLSVIKESIDGSKIILSKHYFLNFAYRYLSKYGFQNYDIIEKIQNRDQDFLDKIEKDLGINIFVYNILGC